MAKRNPSGKKPSFPLHIQPSIDLVVANLHFVTLDGVWFNGKDSHTIYFVKIHFESVQI